MPRGRRPEVRGESDHIEGYQLVTFARESSRGSVVQKKIGIALAGLGAFLLVLAVLSRFYMYDRLAVVPLDQETVSFSVGEDATVFSIVDQQEITTDLRSTVKVAGDIEASEEASEALGRDVAVWEKSVTTNPPDAEITEEQPPLSFSHDYIAHDRHTGEVLDWEESFISSSVDPETGEEIRDTDTVVDGLYFKFPFNVEKKNYTWWDGSLKKGVEIEYQGEEEIQGLNTYEFRQVIEPTDIADIDAPASIFGIDEEGDVTLDRMYSNTRTLWIEPETGVVIRSQEEQFTTADYEGEPIATLTEVTSVFDDQSVTDNVDEYAPLSSQLKIVRVWLPVVGGILGLLLVAAGVVVILRGRERDELEKRHRA
jgi:Porin PorA